MKQSILLSKSTQFQARSESRPFIRCTDESQQAQRPYTSSTRCNILLARSWAIARHTWAFCQPKSPF